MIRLIPTLLFLLALSSGCRCDRHHAAPAPAPPAIVDTGALDAAADAPPTTTTVTVSNGTVSPTTVFVSFGSDSVVTSWPFCTQLSKLSCQFPLKAHEKLELPLGGKYLNATFSFNAAVTCGVTKAELNVNNPQWYDIADVSLVDGFSNFVMVVANGTKLGPPHGKDQNEKVFGVFPLGCDTCTARTSPPCDFPTGSKGCKSGTQYKPDVPCQYQGPRKGGGGTMDILLLQPEPALPLP